MNDSWTLTEQHFRVEDNCAREGLFAQGNGYLHIRASLEEHLDGAPQNVDYMRMPANVTAEKFPETKAKWGTYVPGIFGPHPLLGSEMINLPFFLGLIPYVDGERLDLEAAGERISNYRRELDLHSGLLRRVFDWETTAGTDVRIAFERFVSGARSHLCVQRLRVECEQEAELTVHAGLDADVRTNGYDHFTSVSLEPDDDNGTTCTVVTDADDRINILSRLGGTGAKWRYAEDGPRRAGRHATFELKPESPVVVEKRTAVVTSRDLDAHKAEPVLDRTEQLGWEELKEETRQHWAARWEQSDVRVEGDTRSQIALRTSIYHLLRAHPGRDSRVSIDAKGYAGEAYWGRFFWDTDIYILPFFIYTRPEAARTLVDFRVGSLSGARANASDYGYPGARYAWESDHRGRECCPSWQYRDHQVHVTADVVYGMAHYSRAAEPGYLDTEGSEVVTATARYWTERMDTRPGEDHPSILGVMGPDEYSPISHNNSYTNRQVAFTLERAAALPEETDISNRERTEFAAAAQSLPVLRKDTGSAAPLVMQCEDFELLAEPPFDLWEDRSQPCAAQVSQERIYRSKCLKQPDVLLLMMLFPGEFTEAEMRRAWDYYVPLTTHDSSLSPGVHAIMAARLGKMEEAWTFWRRSAELDLDIEHGAVAQGIHIAAAANNWQVAVLGFGGMSTVMESDTLTLNPRLPEEWDALEFPVVWKGSPLSIRITQNEVTVRNDGPSALQVSVMDEDIAVGAGETKTVLHGSQPDKEE